MRKLFFIAATCLALACAYANQIKYNELISKDENVLAIVDRMSTASHAEREELTKELVSEILKLQNQIQVVGTEPQ